jgi:hypothetical protein
VVQLFTSTNKNSLEVQRTEEKRDLLQHKITFSEPNSFIALHRFSNLAPAFLIGRNYHLCEVKEMATDSRCPPPPALRHAPW